MKTITIIGGGASGTLLAINLIRNAGTQDLQLNLVERRKQIGRGVAFGTVIDVHLLNVPAGKMGAFPDDVEHFHKWLVLNDHDYETTSFVPRKIYGEYLHESLDREIQTAGPNIQLDFIDDEAVDITRERSKPVVVLRSGRQLISDKVALAFGNFRPPDPSVEDQTFTRSDRYFRDPWSPDVYENIAHEESVFIVGTGLSMADVVLQLFRNGHTGKITAISTRGLLPAKHKLGFTYPSFCDELESLTRITDILKVVRRHIRHAEQTGSDWRAVFDSLRPVTQEIWLRLPVAEKRYFMQHLSRYWNVARHRMPMEAGAVLGSLQQSGRLSILKGRLKAISTDIWGAFNIEYSTVGELATARAEVLINCIGSETNYSRIESTLVRNLIRSGQIRNDALSMGLDAEPDGRIVDSEGKSSNALFTLGTALKGILWESTAIPEIRVQASQLSELLLNE